MKKMINNIKKYCNYFIPITVIVTSLIPLFLSSIYAPLVSIPIFMLGTIILLYFTTNKIQKVLNNFDNSKSFLLMIFPIEVFIVLWGYLLINRNRAEIFIKTVCVFFILVIYAIWPLILGNLKKSNRRPRSNYLIIYCLLGAFVAITQVNSLLRII